MERTPPPGTSGRENHGHAASGNPQAVKALLQHELSASSSPSLARLRQLTEQVLGMIRSEGDEDLRLLTTLHQQLSSSSSETLLTPSSTQAQVSTLLREREARSAEVVGALERESGGDTREQMREVRVLASERLVDVIDAGTICRNERIRLLGELLSQLQDER
mmetsp:Transcript_303/g.948  ORF Transcript_303/g.948 Transcript_303/m.948 type:complete len:163 (-) Transcript_303:162-650(-)